MPCTAEPLCRDTSEIVQTLYMYMYKNTPEMRTSPLIRTPYMYMYNFYGPSYIYREVCKTTPDLLHQGSPYIGRFW